MHARHLRKLKYAYQTLRKLKSVHKGVRNKERRTQIKPTSVNNKILLFGLQIITTVCSPSDLVGIFYPWCLEVWTPLSVVAEQQEGTRGFLIQTSVLYRPAMDLSCGTGLPWISHSARRQRYRVARWSTCAGHQLSCLASKRTAEKLTMVSTSSSCPIHGL